MRRDQVEFDVMHRHRTQNPPSGGHRQKPAVWLDLTNRSRNLPRLDLERRSVYRTRWFVSTLCMCVIGAVECVAQAPKYGVRLSKTFTTHACCHATHQASSAASENCGPRTLYTFFHDTSDPDHRWPLHKHIYDHCESLSQRLKHNHQAAPASIDLVFSTLRRTIST